MSSSAVASPASAETSLGLAVDTFARALFGETQEDHAMSERLTNERLGHKDVPFLALLSARHLPRIVGLYRAMLAAGAHGLLAHSAPLTLGPLIQQLAHMPYFSKYIRDSPVSIGHGFILAMLADLEEVWIVSGPPRTLLEGIHNPPSAYQEMGMHHLAIQATTIRLVWLSMTEAAQDSIVVNGGKNFRRLLQVLIAAMSSGMQSVHGPNRFSSPQAQADVKDDEERLEIPFLTFLVTEDHKLMSETSGLVAESLSWLNCEAKIGRTAKSVCEDVPTGTEMMACARCGTVRYCSKAHQRNDWKRHKAVCFPVTWTAQTADPQQLHEVD